MPEFNKTTRKLRIAGLITGLAFGVVTLLALVAPMLPGMGIEAFFSSVCHQQPGRSHQIDGVSLAVCVRCFWLYVGLFIGHARFLANQRIPRHRLALLAFAAAIAMLSWLGGWFGILPEGIALRVISSLLTGIAVSHYTVPGASEIFFPKSNSPFKLPMYYGNHRT